MQAISFAQMWIYPGVELVNIHKKEEKKKKNYLLQITTIHT